MSTPEVTLPVSAEMKLQQQIAVKVAAQARLKGAASPAMISSSSPMG